ncbi:2-phosphosulfolactate phosphatase [Methylobacterium terricola]|uniref:Probable 2-phosphosulfolactate phosphatase n=1 Tax=Methylobacterium terricola TaxID=2583531 RepID=A0A5C4LAF7_9HYPH|nr:2-phosphosulfolactate phosphatase [Methylobacterium terricola]TNC08163.1 2-phosphosulfolactate phosphatase [Methylobacterium terricola]
MDIVIESLLDGARRARGHVAIIDVFRAFTTAAVALAKGASEVVMVGSADEALALRAQGRVQLCMGEIGGRAPPGFDFGNSPYEVSAADLAGCAIAQRTGAGTQGIVAAAQATRLYAASLVTASATARALVRGTPAAVTLVAMGNNAVVRTDEDEICALHLRNLIEGRPGHVEGARQMILASREASYFGDPTRPHLPRADLDIALDIDRYDFAIRVELDDGYPVGRAERAQ